MTAANVKLIYNLVPGFKWDRDEDWMLHLPQADLIYMRRGRSEFIQMKERLDELKSDQKEYLASTARHQDITRKIEGLTRELDTVIKEFLNKIPILKRKAIQARDAADNEDIAAPSRKRSAADLDEDRYEDVTSTFDAFLPCHMFQPKPPERPEPVISQQTTPNTRQTSSSGPAVKQQPKRDTYLDGVPDIDIAIMKKLRPVVEKFNCKDRVLEAVRRFRERQMTLDTLELVNSIGRKT